MYKHGNNVRREIILIPTPLSLGFHITEIRVKSIVAILCVPFQFANSCKKEQCMLFRKKKTRETANCNFPNQEFTEIKLSVN